MHALGSPSLNPSPSVEEADTAFEILKSMDLSTVWSEGRTRIRGSVLGREEGLMTRLTPNRKTSAASGHFHFAARMAAHYRSHESPADIVEEHRQSLASKSPGAVRRFIRGMTYVPAQFNPAVARAIIQEFGGGRVLDPCAGWGDRLAAALASPCVKEYHGVDANASLQGGYAAQIDRYLTEGRSFMVTHGAFEDVAGIPLDHYDLAFTSPPYFDTEFYSPDPEQSCLRYPRIEQWVGTFLTTMLTKTVRGVRGGGHIVLNIANLYRGKKTIPLCEFACEIMEAVLGCEFKYLWGMSINDRQHLGSVCEPVLVWEKPHGR